ncbi:TRAP transporter substrate-binding protein [Rhizobium sp. L1K21]|uniref:TRAP transporter substrate-binding protein n=1 Tax=Rhizobium sp. L1K21 TaxID=2954933 RepID=UPI002091FAC9|nr:TRAP transporter substrate-binding protein [Rhizobium sp. L1K21]MCO6188432.1 TRAP transporter substrate-binding protein [Rhizobium sp. L1K21]
MKFMTIGSAEPLNIKREGTMKNYMKRGLLAAAFFAAGLSPAAAETVLKVSNFLPPNHTWQHALEAWSEELKAKTNGELSLEIFPAGQLGPPPRQYQIVTNGLADMAIILYSATPGRFPLTELAGLPLTSPSEGNSSEIMSRRLTELAPEYLAQEHPDTKILWMAVTPPLKLSTTTVDVTKPEDIKGLRVRYAGKTFQEILETFGASPMNIGPAETVDALSKGVADGAMFPFEATKSFNLGPIVHYTLEPGLASAPFGLVMSQAVYDGLSPELQKAIDETVGPERAAAFGKSWDEGEADGRQYMVDNGVKIETLSGDQLTPFREAVAPIIKASIASVDDSGKPGSAFYEAYTK